ncbi:MAG: hypothetical protein HGA54_02900 [Actinobacteria bacterium]|nr:hypothetical protein [Actinomycetota bacterium]
MSQTKRASKNNRLTLIERFQARIDTPAKRIVAGIIGVLLVGSLAFSAVDALVTTGKIHPGVTVAGIDVGGMTKEDASVLLEEQLTARLETSSATVYASKEGQIQLEALTLIDAVDDGGSSAPGEGEGDGSGSGTRVETSTDNPSYSAWDITPSTIGAGIDGVALASEAYSVGRTWTFFTDRLAALLVGYSVDPQIVYDESLFIGVTGVIDQTIGTPVVNASISIQDGIVSVTPASSGNLVDKEIFSSELAKAFLLDTHSFVVTMRITPYVIDDTEAEEVAQSVRTAIASPVTMTYEGSSWEFGTGELGSCLGTRIEGEGDAAVLVPFVEPSATEGVIMGLLGEGVVVAPVDARFLIDGDTIAVSESQEGKGPDLDQGIAALQTILFGESDEPVDRNIALQAAAVEPALSTEAANSRGIIEQVSTYTVEFHGSGARVHNIYLLCDLLNGMFIEPNTTWSFHESVGECNEEKGFEAAGAIVSGEYVDQIGGGICLVATTLFNAAFEAGFPIDERHNHSLFIVGYPEGRDATVSYPSPDLKFTNETSSWLMITADYTETTVTITLWGTSPGYTVASEASEWTEGAAFSTRTLNDDTMYIGETRIETAGENGKSIIVTRYVTDDGENIRTDTFKSVYKPRNEVIYVGTKEPPATVEVPATTESPAVVETPTQDGNP